MGALGSLLLVLLAGTTASDMLVVRAAVRPARNLTSEAAPGAAQPGSGGATTTQLDVAAALDAQAAEAAQAAAAADAAVAAAAVDAGVQQAAPEVADTVQSVDPMDADPAAAAATADPAAAADPAPPDAVVPDPQPQPQPAAVPPGACPNDCHAAQGFGRCDAGRCICVLGRGGRDCTFNLE